MFKKYLIESYSQTYYRGLSQPYDDNYYNHIIWVSSSKDHANTYAQGRNNDEGKEYKPNVTEYNIDSKNPVDFGYRHSMVMTSDKEFYGRVKDKIMDAFSNKKIDRDTAKSAFNKIDNIPITNEYKCVWEWRENNPLIKETMQQIGHDSFNDREEHLGKSVNTVGLFHKSQLNKIK